MFERGYFLVGLSQIPFCNDFYGIISIEKNYTLNSSSSNINVDTSKKINIDSKTNLNLNLNKKPKIADKKIDVIRHELSSNLKHLEFILAFENQLADLASKDKCNLERLEDFMKIKKDVQLKIIELSQTITYYQSQRIAC
ncbi:hypothetical protein [Flaviramulus basaltis]|uniref:hypothetical protein n=1 Tax=Flaviramulus basaltis TaxID=369401 RepID=UPI0009314AAB|nr:hypothetical protein [Flaviramulus basaltis]